MHSANIFLDFEQVFVELFRLIMLDNDSQRQKLSLGNLRYLTRVSIRLQFLLTAEEVIMIFAFSIGRNGDRPTWLMVWSKVSFLV